MSGVDFPHNDDPLDPLRSEFLHDLDNSDLDITDWEAKFIESNLSREHFTDRQRAAIDLMRTKYQGML